MNRRFLYKSAVHSQASGRAECEVALDLMKRERAKQKGRLSPEADKNYDIAEFVAELRGLLQFTAATYNLVGLKRPLSGRVAALLRKVPTDGPNQNREGRAGRASS